MEIINGQKYSNYQFEDYKLRLMVRVESDKVILPGAPYPRESLLTFYTDEDCVDEAKIVITEDIFTDKITSWNFEHVSTKEQDDLISEFMEKALKDY